MPSHATPVPSRVATAAPIERPVSTLTLISLAWVQVAEQATTEIPEIARRAA